MRQFMSYLFITLLAFGLLTSEASAKRFGGGKSIGVQRSQSSLSRPQSTPSAAAAAKKPGFNWGGMLGGLLVGGLLASLFMGHGLASGILSWLLVGAVVLLVIAFIRSRMQPSYPSTSANYQSASPNPYSSPYQQNAFNQPFAGGSNQPSEYPAGFDPEEFLRNAKITFIRLQAAYDQKNLADLSQFTAPEIFAEIKMQIEERGNEPNVTEVGHLEAELLDVSKQSFSLMASVRFTGSIKENNDPITQLNEIWHFRQFENSSVWVVGGIQQEIVQP